MRVEAVIFDWAGTLTPWCDIDILGQWSKTAMAIDPDDADRLGAALHAAERQLMRRCLDDSVSATLEQIFTLAEIPMEHLALDAYLTAWTPYTHIDPQGAEVLAGLKERGIMVGVLSNTTWPRGWHEDIFERDGVLDLIDAAVYSSEIAWTKPHPEAFRSALRALGDIAPQHAVFVGDRLFEDVYGAKAAGMRAVHIPKSTIPVHELGHTDGEPDATVHDLRGLLPLVDEWNAAIARERSGG
ncbi:HAD family hydrolase [Actinosynnema sp. NPDC050436]|uniref:HAD family hydrolase n=1 Tax=Actinosynnema sp. NPDC050436 TaxID=3155659 RepID=UPI003401A02B